MKNEDRLVLRLAYRPPYDWPGMLEFLSRRMIKQIEHVTADSYARTVRIDEHTGWVRVTHAAGRQR